MAIRKLPNGKWQVQVDVGRKLDGSRDRRSRICKSQREAKRVEAEFAAQRIVNRGVSGRITLEDFVEGHWKPLKREICTYETFHAYEGHLRNHILPKLGRMNLCDIKHLHVQQMISACPTEKTARNAKSTLYNVLQMAVDLGGVPSNAAASRGFQYPRKPGTAHALHGEWLTDFKQHRELIDAAEGERVRPILVLGLCFGLRKGEILGLDWEHVDFDAGCIHVVQSLTRDEDGSSVKAPKTPASVRDIPMTGYARKLLVEMRGESKGTGPIVTTKMGRMSPGRAQKLMRRFVETHDVPQVTILSLRHSFATSAVRAGVNIASISRWLGHTNVTTTLTRYVLPLQKDLKVDVADVIDGLY